MNEKEKATKSLSIRFPARILEQMKEIAKDNNRSLNGEILTALEEHIKRNQKGKKKYEQEEDCSQHHSADPSAPHA